MITQIVMILSIVCLFWAGIRIFKRSEKIHFFSGKLLAWGLFLIGFSIVFYAIRDIFIQLNSGNIEIVLYMRKAMPMKSKSQITTDSITKKAPLEVIDYKVISHPWELKIVNFAFLGSILLFGTIVFFIFLFNVLRQQNQKMRAKGLLYGTGILFLFAPAILCVFISPIFARIGYVLGAVLIYKAFDMKV